MITAPISTGELYDKISILEIKKKMGLDVDKELNLLLELSSNIPDSIIVDYLLEQLMLINKQIWDNENNKRECESKKDFNELFVQYARAVYFLNDERARIKRTINNVTNSEIIELKQHKEY